jgi:hypothetical protein
MQMEVMQVKPDCHLVKKFTDNQSNERLNQTETVFL